jgi:hypothetical protein
MSRDYTFRNTPKFTTYPSGISDSTAVLMTAADGSLVSLTLNGLNTLLHTNQNTFPSATIGTMLLTDGTITRNLTH